MHKHTLSTPNPYPTLFVLLQQLVNYLITSFSQSSLTADDGKQQYDSPRRHFVTVTVTVTSHHHTLTVTLDSLLEHRANVERGL